ncbi:MAG: hypothetical protein ACR2FO_09000 [Actinomycetota bacterium]
MTVSEGLEAQEEQVALAEAPEAQAPLVPPQAVRVTMQASLLAARAAAAMAAPEALAFVPEGPAQMIPREGATEAPGAPEGRVVPVLAVPLMRRPLNQAQQPNR